MYSCSDNGPVNHIGAIVSCKKLPGQIFISEYSLHHPQTACTTPEFHTVPKVMRMPSEDEPGSYSLPPRLLSRRVCGTYLAQAVVADGQHHRPEQKCPRQIPCVLSRLPAHDVQDGIGRSRTCLTEALSSPEHDHQYPAIGGIPHKRVYRNSGCDSYCKRCVVQI